MIHGREPWIARLLAAPFLASMGEGAGPVARRFTAASPQGGEMTSRGWIAACGDSSPCRAWAVQRTEPSHCAAHGGATWPVGAPPGNQKALEHGCHTAPGPSEDGTIDAVVDVLYQRQLQLDDYMAKIWGSGVSIQELALLLRIHGQNASQLGRLLRDRRALSGHAADGISDAIAQALDELSSELEVHL